MIITMSIDDNTESLMTIKIKMMTSETMMMTIKMALIMIIIRTIITNIFFLFISYNKT